MTLITNDCLATFIYKKLNQQYESPFMSSLFESDEQYLKFCQNFAKYIKKKPRIGKPKLPVTVMDITDVPVMFLGDIEIHWPHHEGNKGDGLLATYQRRKKRINNVKFIWSDMQIFNTHSQKDRRKLIREFKKIPNSIFVNKDDIEAHKDKSIDDRTNDNFMNVPKWLDYDIMAEHIIKIL